MDEAKSKLSLDSQGTWRFQEEPLVPATVLQQLYRESSFSVLWVSEKS